MGLSDLLCNIGMYYVRQVQIGTRQNVYCQSPPFNPKKIFQQVPVVDTVNNNEAIINKASPRFIDYSVIYTVP